MSCREIGCNACNPSLIYCRACECSRGSAFAVRSRFKSASSLRVCLVFPFRSWVELISVERTNSDFQKTLLHSKLPSSTETALQVLFIQFFRFYTSLEFEEKRTGISVHAIPLAFHFLLNPPRKIGAKLASRVPRFPRIFRRFSDKTPRQWNLHGIKFQMRKIRSPSGV